MPVKLLLSSCLLFFITNIQAQQYLSGKIYDADSDSLLAGVTVVNKTTKTAVRSSLDGSYSIAASENDIIIFSRAGYASDTMKIEFHLLLVPQDITLSIKSISLQNVTVRGGYYLDSLNRRTYYGNIYDSLTGIRGRNRPTDGFGVSISPLSYFSKRAKDQRKLRKRLVKDEREAYIDHSFPPEWVARITGLKDDSLRLFLYRYRPSYDFCRENDRDGMLLYINDKLKEFKKPQPNSKNEL